LDPVRLLRAARANLLGIWGEDAFQMQFFSANFLSFRVYVCNSPDTVREAMVTRNADFERKSPQMRHALKPLVGDGLFISDGATWAQRRPIVQSAAHASRLPLFAPLMIEAAVETVNQWARQKNDRPVDMLWEMARLTSEIISRTIFGKDLGAVHARTIVDGFSNYQENVGQLDLISLLGLPDWVPRLHGPSVRNSARRIRTTLKDLIENAGQTGDRNEVSLVQLMARSTKETDGAPLDSNALLDEATVLFMAGHETTANTLAWAWYLLSQAPDVQARMHAELDAVLRGRVPTLADVPKLVYTRAILDETMRLYPPVPVLSRQAVCDSEIRRRKVKAGSLVLVVPWLLHRHKRLWDAPDAFIPERFLPENSGDRDKYAYIPFAIGPRVCAGASFAITEAVLCMAILAQRFAPRLKPGTDVEPIARLTIRPKGGLPMFLDARTPVDEQPSPEHMYG
jgi:cytochrome P450